MVRLILIVASVWGCLSAIVNAEMLTDTRTQDGTTILGTPGTGKLVRLATFSIPSQPTNVLTHMSLRLFIEQSAMQAPPQLLFTQAGSNPLTLFSGPSLPLQNIGLTTTSNNNVYEYLSPLISLSSFDSLRLSSLIGSNSAGNVDAYLYSPTASFSIPQSSSTWSFSSGHGLTTSTTNIYTTTLSIVAVPEPMTAIAFGLGAVALCVVRNRLRRNTK